MSAVQRTQYIFIDSERCDGTPYSFDFTIPINQIVTDKEYERVRVSLVKWTCRFDWYAIRFPDNTFQVSYGGINHVLEIPEGNYTYSQFATKLTTLLVAIQSSLGVTTGDIVVEYSAITNKLKFIFPNATAPRIFIFPANKCYAFGFPDANPYTTGISAILNSTVPMNFWYGEERLLIICDGLHPSKARSLTHTPNEIQGAMGNTDNIMASVLINNYPYETITFINDGQTYAHYIHDRHVHGRIRCRIVKTDGTPADFLSHNHMVIRIDIEYINNDAILTKQLEALKNIEDFTRMGFVATHLNSTNLPP